jgi:hypothetical protein
MCIKFQYKPLLANTANADTVLAGVLGQLSNNEN